MGFREAVRHWPFALGLAARGLLAGCLVAGGAVLALSGRLALGLIAWTLAMLTLVALVTAARRAERAMRDLVDQIASGADDLPPRLPPAFADLDAAIARAIAAMAARTLRRGADAEADAALLDTVPAALFVADADDRLVRSNRAARGLAPNAPAGFADHPAFAPADAVALLRCPPDAGRMLRLADGRAAHASVTLFDLPDGTRRRLIAVQPISEGLSAVESDAWHRLSRVLAHEMMNSLSPVISLADSLVDLARDPAADPDRRETGAAAATIARRAQHLISFVERYRQWLAVPQPEPTPVDLAGFAADLARLARGFDPQVRVRMDGLPTDATVAIDRELIEQALLNLLKNAVEAARGQPQPMVTLRYGLDASDVVFAIEDNGAGLPADTEDMFLPFYTTKANGAGIGLAIARQIASAHGGRLTAERKTQGARFILRCPVRQAVEG